MTASVPDKARAHRPAPAADPYRAKPAKPSASRSDDRRLRCRVKLADGRLVCAELSPERHRALQLSILHSRSAGLVELAAGTRRDGALAIHTRARADHFLPGGATDAPAG